MAMLAMTPRVRTTSVPRIDTPMYLGRTPYVNNAAYIPSTPLTVGTPFIGRTPYTAPLALDSIHIAVRPSYPAFCIFHLDLHLKYCAQTPRMPGPLYDPLMSTLEPHSAYDELAALTIPPGSVRMRRLSKLNGDAW